MASDGDAERVERISAAVGDLYAQYWNAPSRIEQPRPTACAILCLKSKDNGGDMTKISP